jgi:hypothetical protein
MLTLRSAICLLSCSDQQTLGQLHCDTPGTAVGTLLLNDQQPCLSFWSYQVQASAWRLVTLAEFVSNFGLLHQRLLPDSLFSNPHVILTASFVDDYDDMWRHHASLFRIFSDSCAFPQRCNLVNNTEGTKLTMGIRNFHLRWGQFRKMGRLVWTGP